MSEIVWIMDSKRCCRCGALLAYFEPIMCTDCLEKAMYVAEQERLARLKSSILTQVGKTGNDL